MDIKLILLLTFCYLIECSLGNKDDDEEKEEEVEQGHTRITSQDMTHVSAGLNYIWGVNQDMDIFMCQRPCTGEWSEIYGKLDVDDHDVWGVNDNDDIYV